MESSAATLLAQQCLLVPPGAELDVRPIRGGLESAVARACVRAPDQRATGSPRRCVVKELRGTHRREADIYRLLWDTLAEPPAARLLGRSDTAEASYLCLEDVRGASAWPWRDHTAAAAVCRALARVHHARELASGLPAWDYEEYLRASAEETLRCATNVRAGDMLPWQCLGELRRVVGALPRMRERLLESGATVIHGDVHPGNVLVRAGTGPHRVVLIDWARSRIGSPLEDVASWLHSLGCWDAEARRRHDSLLAVYLRACQPARRLEPEVRTNYWLASASNGLAGAIRYHIEVLSRPLAAGKARQHSRRALDEWQRIIHGAARIGTTRCC
jgi:aminoglycoside phosphotransferase (APT) family kinase protein